MMNSHLNRPVLRTIDGWRHPDEKRTLKLYCSLTENSNYTTHGNTLNAMRATELLTSTNTA